MTVSAPVTYPEQFSCNGLLTSFDFTFGIYESSELEVIHTDADGVETVLTETTNYSVSATNSDYSTGGTVTTVVTYATGETITIFLAVPITQESNFVDNQATLYETFELGLDKLTRICQQLDEIHKKSLSFLKTSTLIGEAKLPTPVDGRFLCWDGTDGTVRSAALAAETDLTDWTTHIADGGAHDAAPQAVTIGAGGILNLTAYPTKAHFIVSAESGTSDTLVQVTGRVTGDKISLSAASGHTITIEPGSTLKMQGSFVLNSPYDEIGFRYFAGTICAERYRSGNA